MDIYEVVILVGLYCAFVTLAGFLITPRDKLAIPLVGVVLLGVVAATCLSWTLRPGSYYVAEAFHQATTSRRTMVVVALTVALALPWFVLPRINATGPRWLRTMSFAVLCLSQLGVVGCAGALVYAHWQSEIRTYSASDRRFQVDRVYDGPSTGYAVRVAVDEKDTVFVSTQIKHRWEVYGGTIVRLDEDPATGEFHGTTIASDPCLYRPFGLAIRKDRVYVARSGVAARANHGQIEWSASGAVTQLQDLDGDGMMDHYHDIVADLPGIQGAPTNHANCAITFDADGNLYIANGTNGDRRVPQHDWEGTILRASPDFSTVAIFARGFRNPFGMVHGPDGDLFCTDNDIDLNPGDELNHVVEDAHYGHPYTVGNEDRGEDFSKPILLASPGHSFIGLAYTESDSIPAEFRNCFYIADLIGDVIIRCPVTKIDGKYTVTDQQPFASIPDPIDIAVTSEGVFYVTTLDDGVFRIRSQSGVKE